MYAAIMQGGYPALLRHRQLSNRLTSDQLALETLVPFTHAMVATCIVKQHLLQPDLSREHMQGLQMGRWQTHLR